MKIGWFSTGRDQAAIDLLKIVQEAIRQGEIKAEIKFIFS
jgi:phosphoribosylglycinamide formyltransferase-1